MQSLYFRLFRPDYYKIEHYFYKIDHNDLNSSKIHSPYYEVLRAILRRYFIEDSVVHNIKMYIEKEQYSKACDFAYCFSNYLCSVKEGRDKKLILPLDILTVLNDLSGNDNPFDVVILWK